MPEKKNSAIMNGSVAYDLGSADSWQTVRRLEGQPVELPPEPEVQSPQVTVVKARHNISLFAVFSYIAVSALMILVVFSYMRLYEVSSETVQYKSELARLTKANIALASEYDNNVDLGAVELVAVTQMGMRYPSSSQIVYLNLSEPDRAEVLTNGVASGKLSEIMGALGKCVDYVRSYFE